VPLHEWKETFELNYSTGLYDLGTEHSPTTWIFEAGSFVPCGKITNGKHYSIITDHLGTPIEAYNQEGALIWEREQDLYGNSHQGFAKENFRCPFKYQGQYYDPEIELCYNRFRYYHPETGRYISEDPIGFLSGEPNFFAYVSDTNAWVDLLGLAEEFEIGTYGGLNGKEHAGDGLDAHELLQSAWLKNNHNIKRGSGISNENPAIALPRSPIHTRIGELQQRYGLKEDKLVKQTALENININTALTRRGIMETLMERDGMSRKQAKKKATDLAMKLREDAINFAKKQGYIREKTSYG